MNLENIIYQLTQAWDEKKNFEYSENGLNIQLNQDENSTYLSVTYSDLEERVEEKVNEFEEFLKELDDDLFVEVCDRLGSDKVNSITETLNGSDLDLILESIDQFKLALSKVAYNKIIEHEKEIKKLTNYVRTDSTNTNTSC